MPSVNAIQTSFSGGQISPKLYGEVESDLSKKSVKIAKNIQLTPQGECFKRNGSLEVQEVKESAKITRMIPFKYGVNEDYQIEFGDQYIRIYNNVANMPVYTGLEFASPFVESEISSLYFTQTKNLVYILSPIQGIKVLTRVTGFSWVFRDYVPYPPPTSEVKTTETNDLTLSAVTGAAVTVTAANPVFNNSAVGRQIEEENQGGMGVITVYTSTTQVTMSIIKPFTSTLVHTWDFKKSPGGTVTFDSKKEGSAVTVTASLNAFGFASVGDYVEAHGGVVLISNVASGTVASGIVLVGLNDTVATDAWILGISDWKTSFPRIIALFQQRIWVASSIAYPNRFWATRTGQLENFALGSNDADGISEDLQTGLLNQIEWLGAVQHLLLGTPEAEVAIYGGDNGVTPSAIRASTQDYGGSQYQQPIYIGNHLIYLDRTTKIIRALAYNFDTQSYQATNLIKRADELTGNGIIKLVYTHNPNNVIWAIREDGVILLGLYDPEDKIIGWSTIETDGKYLDLSVITNNNTDQVWAIVERVINGSTIKYIEVFDPAILSDSIKIYDGVPTITIAGLSHLEGKTVQVKADHAYHPDRVVTGGQITLQDENSHVEVGLPYEANLELLEPEINIGVGSMQSFPKRRVDITLRVNESFPPLVNGNEFPARDVEDPMDTAVPLYTGDLNYGSGVWGNSASLVISQLLPFPFRLVAIFGSIDSNLLS